MDRGNSAQTLPVPQMPNLTAQSTEFVLTPYKICTTIFIRCFCEERHLKSQHEVGQFCLLAMKLTQGLGLTYGQFIEMLSPPNTSDELYQKLNCKLEECSTQLSHLMDLMSNLKTVSAYHRTSIVGLFLRRMILYFDKLPFSGVSRLFREFCEYVNVPLTNTENAKSGSHLLRTCPKQMQYFIGKQLNLIQVNEKKAMNPRELSEILRNNCKDYNIPALIQNDFNDVHFLRYLNSLRVNEYSTSKEALMTYFDGNANSVSRCWAGLNLAILHSHFGHSDLALQSIKECISAAQELNDEKCLEYALLWLSRVLQQQEPRCDVSLLLNHLQTKSSELSLPYITAISQLQSEERNSLDATNKIDLHVSYDTSLGADVLAVKHSMGDVLLMAYSSQAAKLYATGATSLAVLNSQVLLHLNLIEPVGDTNVCYMTECTCIGIRNIALHLWYNVGNFSIARDMLTKLVSLSSLYKTGLSAIWNKALAEIDFSYYLNTKNWKNAVRAIDVIRSYDAVEADLKVSELKMMQGDKTEAVNCINAITSDNDSIKLHTKVRILIQKVKLMNDLNLLFECIELATQCKFFGLKYSCLVFLAQMLNSMNQISHSQNILNSIKIELLANGTCDDIANSYYIEALNNLSFYKRQIKFDINATAINNYKYKYLDIAIKSNEKAIQMWQIIEDKSSLRQSLTLQALLCNHKNDLSQRNFYSRQVRLLNEDA